jgi:aminoglycoside phosphotransferase (APT) family kinase protein
MPDLDLDALQARLSAAHPSVDLRGVELCELARCGDGLASTADRVSVRLRLGDDQPTSEGLPEQIVVKTILLHPALRFGLPVILTTAKLTRGLARVPLLGRVASPTVFALIGVYQRWFPHAPAAMYINEARFYAELRPELDIVAPRAYASWFDPRSGSFQIAMEDLRARQAEFPNATGSRTLAQIRSLIDTLARLHAHTWASPRFADDLAWVATTRRGGMFPVFDAIGLDLIRDQVRRSPDKRELIAPLGRSLDSLWADMWRVQAEFERDPPTLCHGDAHIGNSYLIGDQAGLLDWQLMVRGCWAHDLSYALATGLSIEDRRAHERDLLGEYLDKLASYLPRDGVAEPPSFEHAWLRYRQGMLWGLVIGWLITPPQNYGVEITRANIGKMVAAMLDLDTLAAIPA